MPVVWLPQSMEPLTDVMAPMVPWFVVDGVVSFSCPSICTPAAGSKLVTPLPSNQRAEYAVPEPEATTTMILSADTVMLNNAAGSAGCANSLITSVPSGVGKLHETTGFDDAPAKPTSPTKVKLAVAGPFGAGASVVVLSIVAVTGGVVAGAAVEVEAEGAAVGAEDLVELPQAARAMTRRTASRPIRPTQRA